MVGLLQWNTQGRSLRPVPLREVSILHTRFLCAQAPKSVHTPAAVERRRIQSAGKKLLRQGIERVVLPAERPSFLLPEGLRAVSTRSLRRAVAADWAGELLRLYGKSAFSAQVLISADSPSSEVIRTVIELALRQRYLLLSVPFGGEALSRRLRQEYGVSVLLNPTAEQAANADLHVAFDPTEPQGGGFLPLYDMALPLPQLLLPHEIEKQLPPDADRGQLLSALWESDALRPGMLTVQLRDE